jgi:hypothetical protein
VMMSSEARPRSPTSSGNGLAQPVRAASDPSCEPAADRSRGGQDCAHGRAALPTSGRRFSLSSHCHHGVGLPPFVSVVTAAAPAGPRAVRLGGAACHGRCPEGRHDPADIHHK